MTVICQLNLCATVKNRPLFSNFFPKRKHKKNPCKHWVCKGFGNLFEIVKTISLITPNAYFTAFFDRLSVTRLLRIFSQAFSRCFIISQLLELYMLGFSGEVKVADCSDHLLSVDNMNLFHII